MTKIIITKAVLKYIAGYSFFIQGVSGSKNYSHTEGNIAYNGNGSANYFSSAELNLVGYKKDGTAIKISIKNAVLSLFMRKRLNDKFVEKLNKKLSTLKTVEVANKNGYWEFSAKTRKALKAI